MNSVQVYKYSLLQDLKENTSTKELFQGIETPAALNNLLRQASRLAAGSEQSNDPFVQSVFSNLAVEGLSAPAPAYFPFRSMELDARFFPVAAPDTDRNWRTGFEVDLKSLDAQGLNDKAYTETLLHVLHKHGPAIPSGKGPDVSLYDFAKSKAGIAVSLWRFEQDPLSAGEQRNQSAPLLIIGGGVSGIQEFIYEIVGANAAKNLKGRSYYLHLLVDSVVRQVLHGLQLFNCNVITASGGNFHILAPNTKAIQQKIDAIKEAITAAIFSKYKTALSFELEHAPVYSSDLKTANIAEILRTLGDKIKEQKNRRHQSRMLDKDGYSFFFEASEEGGEAPRDVITGEELDPKEPCYVIEGPLPVPKNHTHSDESLIAYSTAQQIFLGRALRDCKVRIANQGGSIVTSLKAVNALEDEFNPGSLDAFHYIIDQKHFGKLSTDKLAADFIAINDLNEFSERLKTAKLDQEATLGFELYGGNDFPYISLQRKDGSRLDAVKTFSELAGQDDEVKDEKYERFYLSKFDEAKFKRLAILRMDVDNLGRIFRDSFKDKGTFAQYYSLSRQLDWFFKGYLNTLWQQGVTHAPDEEQYAWKDHVQITYSGGDDLFIVGKWNCVMEMAQKIREEFKKWTCQHPGFDISGAITIVTPKFPIYAAATQCGADEKKAKKHQFALVSTPSGADIQYKKSFCLLGTPLNWDHEFKLVLQLRKELTRYYKDNRFSVRALIQQIQHYEELSMMQKKNNQTQTWRWRLAYQLQRAAERYNRNSESFFTELIQGVFFNKNKHTTEIGWVYHPASPRNFLNLLSLAARWTELEHRFIERKKS